MINLKNKKGMAPLILVAIGLVAIILLPAILGLGTGFKLNNIFSSLPPIAWLFIIGLLIALMWRKRK